MCRFMDQTKREREGEIVFPWGLRALQFSGPSPETPHIRWPAQLWPALGSGKRPPDPSSRQGVVDCLGFSRLAIVVYRGSWCLIMVKMTAVLGSQWWIVMASDGQWLVMVHTWLTSSDFLGLQWLMQPSTPEGVLMNLRIWRVTLPPLGWHQQQQQ